MKKVAVLALFLTAVASASEETKAVKSEILGMMGAMPPGAEHDMTYLLISALN